MEVFSKRTVPAFLCRREHLALGLAHSAADGMNEVVAIYKNFIASRTGIMTDEAAPTDQQPQCEAAGGEDAEEPAHQAITSDLTTGNLEPHSGQRSGVARRS